MIEVSQDQFYRAIGPEDIVSHAERDRMDFTTRARELVGKRTPGYVAVPWNQPHRYWLIKRFADRVAA